MTVARARPVVTNTNWPLPRSGVVGNAGVLCPGTTIVIIARTAEVAEDLLVAGALRCARCNAAEWTAWGYGRERTLRSHAGPVAVRPRRVRCRGCGSTHIVLPAALQPRRADTTAVIGTALQHKADGLGYRRIAVLLDRPESTVRRWLRRATPGHLQWIYQRGIQRLARLAPDALAELRYTGNLLRHALSVLAATAYWDRHRCGFTDPPWTLLGLYTRGRLLAPPG